MAKETVTTISCDVCGETAASNSFIYDRITDAAGSMENVYYDVDLCQAHFDELVRKHGHPKEHRLRLVNRSDAIAYGSKVKSWAEMQCTIWRKMSNEEKLLALAIISD